MKKIAAATAIVAAGFVGTAGAVSAAPPANTGPGGCSYGQVHAGLAQSGVTGSAHFPGKDHKGASGFCPGMPNF